MLGLSDHDVGEALPGAGGRRVIEAQRVVVLQVERDRAEGSGDLDAQGVLAPGGHAGGLEGADGTPVETGGEQRGIVHGHPAALRRRLREGPFLDERVQDAAHAGHLLAGDELRQVDGMGPQVTERAGAGMLLLEPPRQGCLGVVQPVLQVGGTDLADLADSTGPDEIAGESRRRHPAVGEPDHGEDVRPGPFSGLGHRRGLLEGVRQWLLAQHVLAGLQCGDGHLGVRAAGGHDVHHVDVLTLDGGPPVRGGLRPPPPGGGGLDAGGLTANQQRHLRTGRQIEEPGRHPPSLRMGGSHETVPDQGDPQWWYGAGHGLSCRGRRLDDGWLTDG